MANSMSQYRQNGVDYIIDDPTVANVFVTTAAYPAGTYVKHEGNLYRFNTDHAAGAWKASEVTQVNIGGELASAKQNAEQAVSSAMNTIAPTFSTTAAYSAGDYVYYNGILYRYTVDHAAGSWNASEVARVASLSKDVAGVKDELESTNDVINNSLFYEAEYEQGYLTVTGENSSSSTAVRTGFLKGIVRAKKPIGYRHRVKYYDENMQYIESRGGDSSQNADLGWQEYDAENGYVRVGIQRYVGGKTVSFKPEDIRNSEASILVRGTIADVQGTIADVQGVLSYVYDDYEQGNISATTGNNSSSASIMRSKTHIALKDILGITIADKYRAQFHFYLYDQDQTFLARLSANLTKYPSNGGINYNSIIADYPTAAYVRLNVQSPGIDVTPSTLPELNMQCRIQTTLITEDNIADYLPDEPDVPIEPEEYFSIENATYTETQTIVVQLGDQKTKNMLVDSYAMYEGTEPPTFYAGRRWKRGYSEQYAQYYGTPHYPIGGHGEWKMQTWRVAPWLPESEDITTITIDIPAGTTLHIKYMHNTYDNAIMRHDTGVHFNAHGYSGFGGPAQTLVQFEMAARLGYMYCITIPKVTKDGVYVCLHDDDSIQATARNDDGSAIDEIYQNRPVSDFTYEELLKFDFGNSRGAPFKGERIPLLEEFFRICAKTGMHPMLSVHPSLSGHWDNIAALAKKYDVLRTLNIKAPTGTIETPMAALLDAVESYTIDTSTSGSLVAYADRLKERYSLQNVKMVIEYHSDVLTDERIAETLAAGYKCGVYAYGSSIALVNSYMDKGVTEFTEDYNASIGLNW